ncbi:unnamed protein product [Echinostoma caproni]|uniref:Doublecortin domain-containing protein n=1 Tax=Echinostoma caproni TaxID=27848 RepID=A0A183A782_9TREM|nr:unnamed protein product [Echinostoma caproni]
MTTIQDELARPVEGAVDKKSGQVINQEIPIAQQGRTKVKNGGPFNQYTAQAELPKHLKKDKKKAPVMFLVDRMRFTKKGYHQYLPYRDIEHFYEPPDRPDTFMLYVKDKKGRKSYETYRCNSPQDVQRVKELIYAAGTDRKKILDGDGTHSRRTSYTSSTESSEYYVERRPYSRISRPRSTTYLPQYSTYGPQYYSTMDAQRSPMVVYRRRVSRAPSVEPRYETYRAPSIRQSTTYIPAQKSYMPADDVTYLRSDNVNGPQIMDNGPVYMYVSRSRPTVIGLETESHNNLSVVELHIMSKTKEILGRISISSGIDTFLLIPPLQQCRATLLQNLNQLVKSGFTPQWTQPGSSSNPELRNSCETSAKNYDQLSSVQNPGSSRSIYPTASTPATTNNPSQTQCDRPPVSLPSSSHIDRECQTEIPSESPNQAEQVGGPSRYPESGLSLTRSTPSAIDLGKHPATVSALAAVAAMAAASFLSKAMNIQAPIEERQPDQTSEAHAVGPNSSEPISGVNWLLQGQGPMRANSGAPIESSGSKEDGLSAHRVSTISCRHQ